MLGEIDHFRFCHITSCVAVQNFVAPVNGVPDFLETIQQYMSARDAQRTSAWSTFWSVKGSAHYPSPITK
jgi:hypothetical protein